MKSKLPATTIRHELPEPNTCDALRGRACLNADGRPKRYFLSRAAAKRMARKHQTVYPCPGGRGFHLGGNSHEGKKITRASEG